MSQFGIVFFIIVPAVLGLMAIFAGSQARRAHAARARQLQALLLSSQAEEDTKIAQKPASDAEPELKARTRELKEDIFESLVRLAESERYAGSVKYPDYPPGMLRHNMLTIVADPFCAVQPQMSTYVDKTGRLIVRLANRYGEIVAEHVIGQASKVSPQTWEMPIGGETYPSGSKR